MYDTKVLQCLAFIKQAQVLGFSLDEIKQIIDERRAGQSPCADVRPELAKIIWIAVDGEIQGIMEISDALKPSSAGAVRALQRLGLEVVMLTGDNRRTAEVIAREVGIRRVIAEVRPDQKAATVQVIQSEGKVVVKSGVQISSCWLIGSINIAHTTYILSLH